MGTDSEPQTCDECDGTSFRTNRLRNLQDHETKGSSTNYLFDPNGNMVLDVSKKMLVEHDWRNMPVSFKFYDHIPDTYANAGDLSTIAGAWQNLASKVAAEGAVLLSEVQMLYDASGNRVQKTTLMSRRF